MSEDQKAMEEIAREAGGSFEDRRDREPSQILPTYKVNNRNPFLSEKEMAEAEKTFVAGIKMTELIGFGEKAKKEVEVTDKIKAVILYHSAGRKLETGSGKTFRTVCQSHDGHTPSIRIDEPLCRTAETKDLVKIMSKWKNHDEAKIDATIKEIVNDEGKLEVCGLKSRNGMIALCPFARKNEVTGKKGDCNPHIYVQAYDIKRKRQFKMELTGKAIWESEKFISPYNEFFKFLRTGGPKGINLPCYAFTVDLSPASDGKSFYLNVSNWKPIASAENRAEMKELAEQAREQYEKQASRLSKEAYNKIKALKEQEKEANAPKEQTTVKLEPKALAAEKKTEPSKPVSFDEDDIPF